MSWQVNLSSLARQDIERALEWTHVKFGKRKHDEYLKLIGLALEAIGVNPHDPRSRSRPELHRDARTFHIGRRGHKARHLFVYRINRNRALDVARFLYDGMDLARHLSDDFAAPESR